MMPAAFIEAILLVMTATLTQPKPAAGLSWLTWLTVLVAQALSFIYLFYIAFFACRDNYCAITPGLIVTYRIYQLSSWLMLVTTPLFLTVDLLLIIFGRRYQSSRFLRPLYLISLFAIVLNLLQILAFWLAPHHG